MATAKTERSSQRLSIRSPDGTIQVNGRGNFELYLDEYRAIASGLADGNTSSLTTAIFCSA